MYLRYLIFILLFFSTPLLAQNQGPGDIGQIPRAVGISGPIPVSGNCVKWASGNLIADFGSACSVATITSISGDGSLITNSLSTGAVVLTVGNAGAHLFWGNNTGSSTTASFVRLACADLSDSGTGCTGGAFAGITLNSGTNFGITAPGAMSSGGTYTIGATTDNLRFGSLGLNVAATGTAGQAKLEEDNLGSTSTDGLVMQNTTPASSTGSSGVIGQISPRLHFISQVWNRNTPANNQAEWYVENIPRSWLGNANNELRFTPVLNGSVSTKYISVCGPVGTTGTIDPVGINFDGAGGNSVCATLNGIGSVNASNIFGAYINGTEIQNWNSTGLALGSGIKFGWSVNASPGNSSTTDTGLARNAAGIVEVNNGTAGTFRDIAVRNVLIEGTTSGTLTLTTPATTTSYTLTLPSSGGTANYAMTTNGSGTASWVAGSSIAGLTTSDNPQFAGLGLNTASAGSGTFTLKQSANTTSGSLQFIRSDASTFGNIYMGGDDRLYIENNGGSTALLSITTAGHIFMPGVSTASAATAADACFQTGNEIVNDSALCIVSARRFKNTIEPSDIGLDLVKQLQPVSYYLNENPERGQQFGFVAEDVEKIDPRFVTYQKDGQIRSVLYIELIPVLTKAIQQLEERIHQLEMK